MEKPIGKNDLIWYVAYGSNLYSRRFQEYLTAINHQGPFPISKPYSIPHHIYFARYSEKWKGGVASLNHLEEGFAYGKAYLITFDEFGKIQDKEFFYPIVVKLPTIDEKPVLTFTQTPNHPKFKPSEAYMSVILNGLLETYPHISKHKLEEYLVQRTASL